MGRSPFWQPAFLANNCFSSSLTAPHASDQGSSGVYPPITYFAFCCAKRHFSASEVTTLWRYTNLFIIIINVQSQTSSSHHLKETSEMNQMILKVITRRGQIIKI